MEAEAGPTIERFGLTKEVPSRLPGPTPALIYSGEYGGGRVTVVCNGKDPHHGVDLVGTVGASLATYLALEAYKPDLVLSAGTAGGFRARGLAIGDVVLTEASINHDRRIAIPVRHTYK
jgi:5'-methylthioadenosine nucleosidase